MTHYNRILSLFLWSLSFAAAGGAARYAARFLIETRYLILLFCILALTLEIVIRPALGGRRDFAGLVLNCVAAATAIISVKWMMEGVHPWLR